VSCTILDEGTLREVTTPSVPAGGRQFDAVMSGPYEAPQFGRDDYITDLSRLAVDRSGACELREDRRERRTVRLR
jgi:hypothetical protein